MRAFISWSGSREWQIAKAFKAWLEASVPELPAFVSPDLPKGETWFATLAQELRGATVGFMCLAPPRVASEWQLMEAGAIWKAARSGGLFPLCFGVDGRDLPEPLRAFQLTRFDPEDFRRLAADVLRLVAPGTACDERLRAIDSHWQAFAARVDAALQQPDDGVHTARGFIHEIAGGWWERVWSDDGETKLSWMWIEPAADGVGLTITGRGFGAGGVVASRWQTDLVSVQAHLPQPVLSYYWEGRHPKHTQLLFGGRGWIRFDLADNGRIEQGSGEFMDVCLSKAHPPGTKLLDVLRATPAEAEVMKGKVESDRRTLVDQKLQAWP